MSKNSSKTDARGGYLFQMILEDCAFGFGQHRKISIDTRWRQLVRVQINHPNVVGEPTGRKKVIMKIASRHHQSLVSPKVLLVHQECRGNSNDESKGKSQMCQDETRLKHAIHHNSRCRSQQQLLGTAIRETSIIEINHPTQTAPCTHLMHVGKSGITGNMYSSG